MRSFALTLLLFMNTSFNSWANNNASHQRSTNVEGRLFQVWKMAKAFGERSKIDPRWIVYFNDPSWIDVLHKIIKDADGDGSSSGLMGNIFSSNGSKLPNTLTSWTRSTLHILDLPNANLLFSHIRDDNNSTLNGFKNYYLIHVPEYYSNNNQKIAEYFADSPLRFDSLTFAFKIETLLELDYSREIIHLFDVYKINESSSVVEVKYYGNWSEEAGKAQLLVSNDVIWKRRRDLKGYHIRAGGALYGTFCTYIENNCTKPDCFKGITGDVWDTLRHVLNFTYTIFENQAWGSLESDSGHSSWNGLIGQLIKDEIDIAAADFTVTFNRSQVVDFLPTLVQSWIQIFIQNPSASRNWLVFIEPITWQAWIVILLFFICTPPIICSIFFFGKEDLKDEFKLSNCYVFAYKALLFHGWNYTPTFLQNRIAFVTVVITAMICYWHWEAMIISYLAVRKIILPYESFEQLLSKSNDKVLTLKGVLYGDMFRYAKDPILRRVYDERMKNDFDNFPESDDQLLAKILEGGYAVFDSASGWKTKQEYLDCLIVDLPIAYSEQLAYAIQKESPFYWLFHYHITKMKESGTLSEIQNKFSSQGQVCPDKSGEALDMNQCFSAFIIIVAGLALALIFLGFETCLPQKLILLLSSFADKSFEYSLENIRASKINVSIGTSNKSAWKERKEDGGPTANDFWAHHSRTELIEEINAHERRIKELMAQISNLSDIKS